MALKLDKHTVTDLRLATDGGKVVTHVDMTGSPLLKLESVTVNLEDDGDLFAMQLQDRTVHDITVIGPPIIPLDPYESDPYGVPTKKGALHLFFPKELELDNDGAQLAREFVVKLTMQDNCSVYFHEFSRDMMLNSPAPVIEYELDNELLGNSMIHVFIEVKKDGKNVFFMKSRNCVDVVEPGSKTSSGTWSISYCIEHKIVTETIRNYIETDSAKIWYSDVGEDELMPPIMIFDKTKNFWAFLDKSNNAEYVYVDASAKSFYLPVHAAHAAWHT